MWDDTSAFTKSITVALRKPGKKDYSDVKAYRLIALLNATGKVLESVIATRISWAVGQFSLLPRSRLGGRRGTSTEHAIHALVESVHSAWKDGKVVTVMLCDVVGAFDNVAHARLLHNLRKRRVGGPVAKWTAAFIAHGCTTLRLPDHEAEYVIDI